MHTIVKFHGFGRGGNIFRKMNLGPVHFDMGKPMAVDFAPREEIERLIANDMNPPRFEIVGELECPEGTHHVVETDDGQFEMKSQTGYESEKSEETQLTKKQIIESLTELGVEHNPKARKDELQALLEESEDTE